MRRSTLIGGSLVVVFFLAAWLIKGAGASGESPYYSAFLITLAAFLTLAVFSFLYADNPVYKFAEHLFVGVSAAYWMVLGFWQTLVPNLIPRISRALSEQLELEYIDELWNVLYVIPVVLGILLLLRLSRKLGWLSRYAVAFIVGTTAGLNFIAYTRSNFMAQISSTFLPLVGDWTSWAAFVDNLSLSATGPLALLMANIVVVLGVVCGLIYFFFSREHSGTFGMASRLGIWILMITFGASFGYTVMGRISLLVGRMTFLLRDWLGIIAS